MGKQRMLASWEDMNAYKNTEDEIQAVYRLIDGMDDVPFLEKMLGLIPDVPVVKVRAASIPFDPSWPKCPTHPDHHLRPRAGRTDWRCRKCEAVQRAKRKAAKR